MKLNQCIKTNNPPHKRKCYELILDIMDESGESSAQQTPTPIHYDLILPMNLVNLY